MREYSKISHLIASPGCLVGPAIWHQNTQSAILHRRLFKEAWPTRPRWQWSILLLVSLLCWYLCFFWIQFYQCIKSTAYETLKSKGVGRNRQFRDLIHLGLWYGVKPSDYYVFRLYGVDSLRWLNYVFSQEQFTWHRVFSCPPEAISDRLVNHKYALERELQQAGIETTTTLGLIQKVSDIDRSLIFQQRNLFIKPDSANAMRGCSKLEFDPKKKAYSLSGYDLNRRDITLEGEKEILSFLKEMVKHETLLIQEFLHNSEKISKYTGTTDLVTIRAISGFVEEILIAYILLEVPGKRNGEWCVYPLDIETGIPQIEDTSKYTDNPISKAVEHGAPVPGFDTLKPVLMNAHQLVPDIKTLSWDLCITDKGTCIIEANTGWALVAPQRLTGLPLLETGFYS